jgi:hypothetical protein
MAETTVAPTNKAIAFRGKPSVERPRAADHAMVHPSKAQLSRKVKRALKGPRSRGMVSEAAAKKHLGEV